MINLPLLEIYAGLFVFALVASIGIDIYHKKTRKFGENEGK